VDDNEPNGTDHEFIRFQVGAWRLGNPFSFVTGWVADGYMAEFIDSGLLNDSFPRLHWRLYLRMISWLPGKLNRGSRFGFGPEVNFCGQTLGPISLGLNAGVPWPW